MHHSVVWAFGHLGLCRLRFCKVMASAPAEMRSLMNGGVADQLVKLGKEHLDSRLPANCDAAALCHFQVADFRSAMEKMKKQWAERKA